jgi:hypothetical protein
MAIRKIQTITGINGAFANIYRDSDYQEYVVRFHFAQPIGYVKEADYFTNDKEDAIACANHVIGNN